MWTALLVLAFLTVFVGTGIGCMWYYVHSDRLKMQRQLDELQALKTHVEIAKTKVAQNAGLALAATHQEAALVQIRAATNQLMRLLSSSAQVQADATNLKSNGAGRSVALFPDLVTQAQRLYETDLAKLASREDIITHIEGARRIEQQLISAEGTAYEPPADMTETIQGMVAWADSSAEKNGKASQSLAGMISESKIKFTDATATAASPTLEQAMSRARQSEVADNQRIITEKTSGAKKLAAGVEGAAEAGKIIAQAQSFKDDIFGQIDQIRGAAKGRQLQAKASNPMVRLQLAAFLTPGYYTPYAAGAPGDQQRSFDQKPISYGKLRELGALAQTLDGLNTFVGIGAYQGNDRPRLDIRYNNSRWPKDKRLFEDAKKTQALMIELGPTLVDMGLMTP